MPSLRDGDYRLIGAIQGSRPDRWYRQCLDDPRWNPMTTQRSRPAGREQHQGTRGQHGQRESGIGTESGVDQQQGGYRGAQRGHDIGGDGNATVAARQPEGPGSGDQTGHHPQPGPATGHAFPSRSLVHPRVLQVDPRPDGANYAMSGRRER